MLLTETMEPMAKAGQKNIPVAGKINTRKIKETVLNLVSLLWQDLINFLHFRGKRCKGITASLAGELRNAGIISVSNFLDREQCDVLRMKIEGFAGMHPYTQQLPGGTFVNHRNQNNPQGPDHGMVDVFDIDLSIPEIAFIDDSSVRRILEASTGQEVRPYRRSAYVNKGVLNTRGFHIDNAQPVIYKAFIYLNDVTDESSGPYSLVSGSQRFSPAVYFNLTRNLFLSCYTSTDMPVYNKKKVITALGKAGTLVLSNQNAIHRGLPQQEGKTRVALVFSYLVVSKLSYLHGTIRKTLERKKA